MSKPANKTLIGAFIIGAIALLVVAVLIFGSGKFLKKTYHAVVFFEGSIKGLNEGAPVIFKGVKIGAVADIRLVYDPVNDSIRIPVIIELEPDKFERTDTAERHPAEGMKLLIERGLRAQLQMQSIVTGQLMIALNFFPDKPATYIGFIKEYPEIPSIPTPLQELAKTIEELHLKEMVRKLNGTLNSVRKLIQHIDKKIDPLITNISKTSEVSQNTLDVMQATLKQTEKTLTTFSEAGRSLKSLTEYLQQHPDSILKGKPR